MRRPATILVVDSAILISVIMGRGSRALAEAARWAILITTDRALVEVSRRLTLGLGRTDLIAPLEQLRQDLTVVPIASLADDLPRAEAALRDAVPSRNGSTRDAHVLALAWTADADIWSADRDFAGSGVASWSTANLMRALAPASA